MANRRCNDCPMVWTNPSRHHPSCPSQHNNNPGGNDNVNENNARDNWHPDYNRIFQFGNINNANSNISNNNYRCTCTNLQADPFCPNDCQNYYRSMYGSVPVVTINDINDIAQCIPINAADNSQFKAIFQHY